MDAMLPFAFVAISVLSLGWALYRDDRGA